MSVSKWMMWVYTEGRGWCSCFSFQESSKRLSSLEEERNALVEKLTVEQELATEAEEQKTRLIARTQEQAQYVEELQIRLEEEEEKVNNAKKEKTKLQEHLKDLEEQLAITTPCFIMLE